MTGQQFVKTCVACGEDIECHKPRLHRPELQKDGITYPHDCPIDECEWCGNDMHHLECMGNLDNDWNPKAHVICKKCDERAKIKYHIERLTEAHKTIEEYTDTHEVFDLCACDIALLSCDLEDRLVELSDPDTIEDGKLLTKGL